MSEEDPKAINLINSIWRGKDSTKCDGNIYGYSRLYHVLFQKTKKVTDPKTPYFKIATNEFTPNKDVDYTFQYVYRVQDISKYFQVEVMCAVGLLVFFYFVLNCYIDSFKGTTNDFATSFNTTLDGVVTKNIYDGSGCCYDFSDIVIKEQYYNINLREDIFTTNRTQFQKYRMPTILLAGCLVYSIVIKMLFNACAGMSRTRMSLSTDFAVQKELELKGTKGVPIDMWTALDALSGVSLLLVVPYLMSLPNDVLLDKYQKRTYDYAIIGTSTLCFCRCFAYFFMIESISKMILTFISMILDTFAFMFLTAWYIFLMSAIFCTVYQNVNPSRYGDIWTSITSIFDGFLASYTYGSVKNYELEHMVLIIIHIFAGNIVLFNYLIAILSSTYGELLESGQFQFKVKLYRYCERYITAHQYEAYRELVLYPAPICVLNFPVVLGSLMGETISAKVNDSYSYFIFWIENVFFFTGFFVFELLLMIPVYFKNLYVMMAYSPGIFTAMFNAVKWAILGPFYELMLIMLDIQLLFELCMMHGGCKVGMVDELYEAPMDTEQQVELFNQVRRTAIEVYLIERKEMESQMPGSEKNLEDEQQKPLLDEWDVRAELAADLEKFGGEADFTSNFTVKATRIADEWKKSVAKEFAKKKA